MWKLVGYFGPAWARADKPNTAPPIGARPTLLGLGRIGVLALLAGLLSAPFSSHPAHAQDVLQLTGSAPCRFVTSVRLLLATSGERSFILEGRLFEQSGSDINGFDIVTRSVGSISLTGPKTFRAELGPNSPQAILEVQGGRGAAPFQVVAQIDRSTPSGFSPNIGILFFPPATAPPPR